MDIGFSPSQVQPFWDSGGWLIRWAPVWALLAWMPVLIVGWRRIPPGLRPALAPLCSLAVLATLELASIPAVAGRMGGHGMLSDPVRIWRLPPHSPIFETNAQGLRNRGEIGPHAGPRILCVGDSWVFGKSVGRDEAWPACLARDTGFEVVNAGCLGYCLYQAYLTLVDPGLSFQPDIAILSNTRNLPQNAAFAMLGQDPAASWRRGLHRSRFYLWLRREYHQYLIARHSLDGEGRLPLPAPEFERRTMERMVEVCRQNGVSVILLDVAEHPGDLGRQGYLEVLAARNGLPLVTVDMSDPRRRPRNDLVHPDAEGHRQIAAALAPVVRKVMEARERFGAAPSVRAPGT